MGVSFLLILYQYNPLCGHSYTGIKMHYTGIAYSHSCIGINYANIRYFYASIIAHARMMYVCNSICVPLTD